MANADRLIELFNGAQHLPAGTVRDAYLAEECGDDAALKAQVGSLVDAHESAGGFLNATLEFSPEIEATLERLKPEQAGQQIGPYKLRERLGEGGFGTVWVAEQERPVRRTVALKIIKLGMDTEDVVARFGQERQALAMMDHPNIAKVIDAGTTEWGRPFFVMELVHGIKITDYCDQANLPTVERLALFIQVCHAVQHAHQKGIIHRDLKPSNILVTLHDGVPVPKVIDFGVAKATQGRLAEHTVYTRIQQMIGTPLYMSPEQAEMNGTDVDTRTDIYTLGVLLYELLTGRTPFDADVMMKAGLDEMRRVIREQEPQKPSTALVTMAQEVVTAVAHHRASEPPKLIQAVRGDLDWIVMKSLEKDRARRYDTANGLAMDIQRHLDNEPVIARPPSTGYRFKKLVRRNQLAFAAGTAIAAALVIGFTTATWMYFRESDARKRATHAEKLATQRLAEVSAERDAKEVARQEAEAISTFMSEVFQSPDPARDGRTITVAETLDKAATKLETELANQPVRRARLQATLSDTYNALGLNLQAVLLQEKVLGYHRSTSGPEHSDTLRAMSSLANSYRLTGRPNDALELREKVVAIQRKVLGPESSGRFVAMTKLAYSYNIAGRRDDAIKLSDEMLTLCQINRNVLGQENPQTLSNLLELANIYFRTDRRDDAFKLAEEVLAIRRKLGPKNSDTIGTIDVLAALYYNGDRKDEALELREESLSLHREVQGPDSPDTLAAMFSLADSYYAADRRPEALNLREEVLTLCRKVRGPEHPVTLLLVTRLTESYTDAGRHDDALKLCEEVLPLRLKVQGPQHPDTLRVMDSLAASCRSVGRHADAFKLREEAQALRRKDAETRLRDSLATKRKELGNDPSVATLLEALGQALSDGGKLTEAERTYREALDMRTKLPGKDSELSPPLSNLANLIALQGRFAEADSMFREAISAQRKRVGEEDRSVASLLDAFGNFLRSNRNAPKAEIVIREAAAMRRKLFGNEDRDLIPSLQALAGVLSDQGKLEEAESIVREELALRRKHRDGATPYALASLGSLLLRQGRPGDAEPIIREAAEQGNRGSQFDLGCLYRDGMGVARDAGEAIKWFRKAAGGGSYFHFKLALGQMYATGNGVAKDPVEAAKWIWRAAEGGYPDALLAVGQMYVKGDGVAKDPIEAAKWYRKVADSGSAGSLNEMAWTLATSVDAGERDGLTAVHFAEKAVAMADRKAPYYLGTLAASHAEVGQFEKAVNVQQEAIALLQDEDLKKDFASRLKLYQSGIPCRNPDPLAVKVRELLDAGKFDEAESPARQCLAIREQQIPGHWRTFNARSMLGGSLLGQKKHNDAEPLLLAGYKGMKQREDEIPTEGKLRVKEAIQRLVQLYETTDRPEQASRWKGVLVEFEESEARKNAAPPR